MNQYLLGAAKRLTFSLLLASTLGGCAVYDTGYAGGYGYDGYPYAAPAYSGMPYYVGPPVSLGLWFDGRSGGHGGYHGHRGGGYHGGGGHRGGVGHR